MNEVEGKGEVEKDGWAFRSSKKTVRSPEEGRGGSEDERVNKGVDGGIKIQMG